MIKDKKTAIVGGVLGIVILLTIFCCKGTTEEVPAVEAAPVEAAVEEVKESVEEAVEELKESIEEILPAETVE